MFWLVPCQLAAWLSPPGECSIINAVELPNSPPSANPWISRAARIPNGAKIPIVARSGISVIMALPSVINDTARIMHTVRPRRSASAPSTSAPTGRARNDTPNVPNVSSSLMVWSCPGKNAAAIYGAKYP